MVKDHLTSLTAGDNDPAMPADRPHRFVLIRHNNGPDDDRVVSFLRARGIEPEIRRPFLGECLGDVDDSVAASFIYGGRYNAAEDPCYPFLRDEHRWIEQCMKRGVRLSGMCQGAQSIAHVLGAYTGPRAGEPCEFGYYEVRATAAGGELFPEPIHVTQCHFHEFHLPAGAEWLATSDLFDYQAMRVGDTTYAFQFHAEITPHGFGRWQERVNNYFDKPGSQTREEQDRLQAIHDPVQHGWYMDFLGKFLGPVLPDTDLGDQALP